MSSEEQIVYRQRFTLCGKPGCRVCAEGRGHGPYWYAYRIVGGKTKQTYIGKTLPPEVEASALLQQPLVRLYTLGQVRLEHRMPTDEERWQPVQEVSWQGPMKTVLGVLASSRERRLSLTELRPFLGSKTSLAEVQRLLVRLEQILEPPRRPNQQHILDVPLIEEAAGMVRLADQTRLWMDADAFEVLVSQAREATDAQERERLLEEALSLYGGDYWPAPSEREATWVLARRQSLRRQWLGVLLDLADLRRIRGNVEGSIPLLEQLLRTEPTHEVVVQRLLLLLTQAGRRAEALRLYQHFAEMLYQDVQATPAVETRALYEAIQAGQTPEDLLPAAQLHASVELKPLTVMQVGRSNQSPLVGRKHELATLRQLLLDAEQRQVPHRSCVILTGEAGIGKTRLVEELGREAVGRGWAITWGRAYVQEAGIPYRVWTEALRKLMLALPGLRQELARRPFLYQPLLALLPDLEDMLPFEQATLAPESIRLWEAIRALLVAISEQVPLLMVLDDVQWADSSSCELLGYLARQLATSQVLLACTYRVGELATTHPLHALVRDLTREEVLTQIAVPPLSDEHIRTLVSPLPEPVLRDIQSRVAGNPFFAEELARTSDLTALPDTIAAVLDVRLSCVSDACRQMLTRAAVLGGSFDFETLYAMERRPGGPTEETLLDLLEEALAAGVLVEEGGSHAIYAFWHPLVVGHLYERLSAARRSNLHRRAAEALQQRYAGHEQQDAALIVYHLVQGQGEAARIASFAELAGDQAYALSAYPDAAYYYRLAVEQLDALDRASPFDAAARLRLMNVLERLGECERIQGQDAEACASFERALTLRSQEAGDVQEQAQIRALLWVEIGKTWYDRRDVAQAQACYAQAQDILRRAQVKDGPAWASLFLQEGYAYWQRGEIEQAREAARTALHLFERLPSTPAEQAKEERRPWTATQRTLRGDPVDLGRTHLLLGTLAAVTGEQEALAHLKQSLTIFERADRPREIAMICCNLGDYYLRLTDLPSAQAVLRRSLSTAERIGDVPILSVASGNLGLIAARIGDLQEAERLLLQAVRYAETMADPFYESLWRSYVSAVQLEQGKIEQAKASLCLAFKAGRKIQSAACVGAALVVLGRLRLTQAFQHPELPARVDRAAQVFQRALTQGDLEVETRLEAQLALAHIAWKQGRLATAQQETRQVLEMAQRDTLPALQGTAQRQLANMLVDDFLHQPGGPSDQQQHAPLWAEARTLFQNAMAIFGRLGMRLDVARTQLDYGEALLRCGDPQGASILQEARAVFLSCQAALDLHHLESFLSSRQSERAPSS